MATGGQGDIGLDLVNVGTLAPDKMHRTVLNRCLPRLLTDLDVTVVMIYIQQNELFDDVTIRDINEQTTTTAKISHLVDQIKKRDQDIYERFKKCLILAKRADLKILLEEEEDKLTAEIEEKKQGAADSRVKGTKRAGAKEEWEEHQTKVKNIDGQDKDDVDAPIAQERINFARLYFAFVTVCTNALREILRINVPMPHIDIYKAILANKGKLKRLLRGQVKLIFPDPHGLTTGKVEEFDISVLYTLIRNISSVPAPSNGWGKTPADKPMDTTLGASVERLRFYRNCFVTRADVKMSQQEFDDYWVKIANVLREIENVIGNHGYLEDLEKCKNSFTHSEAHELQKKFEGTEIPEEIFNMDDRSIQLFKNALNNGKVKVYRIRVMVVGHQGVGKTTLTKRFLGKDVNISERQSTEGIDIHLHRCLVPLSSHKWILQTEVSEEDYLRLQCKEVLTKEKEAWSEAANTQEVQTTVNSTHNHATEDPTIVPPHPDVGNLPKSNANTMVITEPEQNISSESHKTDYNIELLQWCLQSNDKIKYDAGNNALLTAWDFAGHHAFYTTHQMFLSRRAIYLLVLDMSKSLDVEVDDTFFFGTKGDEKRTVRELFEDWMNSVHCCALPDNNIMDTSPPVIIVGTHADKIQLDNRHEICEKYFSKLRSYIDDKPSMWHLVEEDFAIDNTVVDSKLEDLKRKIVEVASRQPYWGEEIPVKWLLLERVMMNLRAQGHKLIDRSQLEYINQADVKISTDELDLFLRFQHEIGAIFYFSIDLLKEKIVLETQFIIKAITSLITTEALFVRRNAKSVISKWKIFNKDGKLTPELIDAVWNTDKNADLYGNKKHILLVMEQLNIIAKPKLYIEDKSEMKEESYYLVPCMLQQKTPEEIISPKPNDQMEISPVLCCVFTGNFLPSAIFHRLVAACIAHWPVATYRGENLIFCGCCVFQLDEQYKLTLLLNEHVIFLRVERMGINKKTPSAKRCIEVKKFISRNLKKIIGYLDKGLEFEYFIQCPECNGVSTDCLINESRLKENAEVCCDFHAKMIESCKVLNFWFEDKDNTIDSQDKDDDDAPMTQESFNYARFCSALINVCSNALREIIIMKKPQHYKDIYEAILVNRAKLKLNKSQKLIVFPDPNFRSTGKLEDFDISILYNIIRNLKLVDAPSNGWGKTPTDNPWDPTLGANVERIHEDRNHFVGHSVKGKISQQEFEDAWAKINKVLHDIQSVIGNHGYLEDLEKRKNQPITPREARDVQKKFQEYKKQIEADLGGIESDLVTTQGMVSKVLSDVRKRKGNQN